MKDKQLILQTLQHASGKALGSESEEMRGVSDVFEFLCDYISNSMPRNEKLDKSLTKISTLAYRLMDYETYLKTRHWEGVRDRCNRYWHDRCAFCYSKDNIEVHHRTYERRGCEWDSDVVSLCNACHAKHHGKPAKNDLWSEHAEYLTPTKVQTNQKRKTT
jgi:hypothetical protein